MSQSIMRNEMREILLLCTENVHFQFRDVVYLQANGVAMGFPLGPVLTGIMKMILGCLLVCTFW